MSKLVWSKTKSADNLLKTSQLDKTKKIKEAFLKSLSVSTINGIQNVEKTKNVFIRYGWLVFICSSFAICLYFTNQIIISYLSYEVITNINVINEQYLQFPTVSFCNSMGGFGLKNLPELWGTEAGFKRTLLNCYFNGEKECLLDPASYFEPFNDSMYGYCYRFNSGKSFNGTRIDILNSTINGVQYGLVLDFLIEHVSSESDFEQLIISIHNHTKTSLSLFNEEVFISAGSRHDFLLKKVILSKLDSPYNDCVNDVSLFSLNKTIIDYIIASNRTYSQKECLNLCRNLKYIENNNCNCSTSIDLVLSDCLFKIPNTKSKTFQCSMEFMQTFASINRNQCDEYCPLECDSIIYSNSYNLERFPISGNINNAVIFKQYSDLVTNYENVKQFFYSIRIYFDSLEYLMIKQQPKIQIFDLVSNIGGVLGLFLGISFLTFAEIIIFILEILNILIKN